MNRVMKNISNRIKAKVISTAKFIEKNLLKTEFYLRNQVSRHKSLDIRFFTLVINGMPFIQCHIETFKKLNINWQWHIVEGVADLEHDTAWSVQNGGRITDELHRMGLSNDGTSEYIDKLAQQYPENIKIYRKPEGQFWDGKMEMCNTILRNLKKECLLWQIDVDEFWSIKQIETMIQMFEEHPGKTAAWFYCNFFVGPRLVVTSHDSYSNNTDYEWFRVWRYKPGMFWAAHEPPQLMLKTIFGIYDVGKVNPFTHRETEAHGLVFDHYAYVLPKQLLFKEIYYGYYDALKQWERLQKCTNFPVCLHDFFGWVKSDAVVEISKPNILDINILEEWKV